MTLSSQAFGLLEFLESASLGQGLLYKSRVRTEPTSVTAPQWTAALWGSLESLIEEMADCCIKVYTLEKVLKVKRDPVTDVSSADFRCYTSQTHATAQTLTVAAGSTLNYATGESRHAVGGRRV